MQTEEKLPIVYSDKYNISFMGLENLHPFDSKKYGRVFEMLSERIGFSIKNIHQPEAISDEGL